MSSNNSQLKKIIGFSNLYLVGLLILLFWGEYYFQYLLGNVLSLIGFFYFLNYFMKYDVQNKHLKSLFFIGLLFFWLRLPFVYKSTMLTPDYDIYYRTVVNFLNGRIPFIFWGTAYGPVYYAFLFSIALLTNGDYYGIKFFFVFLDFLNIIMLYFITNHLKIKNNYKICLLYALIPVSIIEFAWNGHNDTGMILLVLISIYLFIRKKDLLAGIFIFLGIIYKFYTALILPIYLIYYYKSSDSFSHFFKRLITIYSPIILAIGGLLIYNPEIVISLLTLILRHSRRGAVLGLISTINNGDKIRGIAGMIITFLNLFPDTAPIFIFFVQDIFYFGDLLEISWLLLGILLFIAFKDQIKNPLFFLLSLTPIVCFFSKILFNFQLFNETLLNINFFILFLILGIFYYMAFKSKEFDREYSITLIFYSVYIFITVYWVNYPWFYLWLIPIMLIYAFKIREGRFLIVFIVFNSFVHSIFWFRGVICIELIFILLLFILLVNILLFWKILEYKDSFKDEKSDIFVKVDEKLPELLKFDMNELCKETKPYNWILFIMFLISIINMILLTTQILIITPIIPNIDIINDYFVTYAFQAAILK
ncbi:MAG: hypothetical protein ACFFDN_11935 [Candidatus Hodarchaeota archaeon]